ncbi:hypothetical protein B0E54_05351 [Micromonospora sp. MH99]|nr:hypothetical protein [Micromonospora sp. MH99]
MVGGRWSVVGGRWSAVGRRRSVVYGRRSALRGLRSVDGGLRSAVTGCGGPGTGSVRADRLWSVRILSSCPRYGPSDRRGGYRGQHAGRSSCPGYGPLGRCGRASGPARRPFELPRVWTIGSARPGIGVSAGLSSCPGCGPLGRRGRVSGSARAFRAAPGVDHWVGAAGYRGQRGPFELPRVWTVGSARPGIGASALTVSAASGSTLPVERPRGRRARLVPGGVYGFVLGGVCGRCAGRSVCGPRPFPPPPPWFRAPNLGQLDRTEGAPWGPETLQRAEAGQRADDVDSLATLTG